MNVTSLQCNSDRSQVTMAKLSREEIALFPLKNIESVVKLFKIHLKKNNEPNLAILSIILGFIENTLTCSRVSGESDDTFVNIGSNNGNDWNEDHNTNLPVLSYDFLEALYQRFMSIIKAHVDLASFGSPKYATREIIKKVSDVVWCTLSSNYYRDRAHLQSIYSYMAGQKYN